MGSEEAGGTLMKDTAEHYLGELIDRCMVQVAKTDHTGKGVKTCRMHDLVQDFCFFQSMEETFFAIVDRKNFHSTAMHSQRIAIHVNDGLYQHIRPHIRSLLCHGISKLPGFSSIYKSFIPLEYWNFDSVSGKFPVTNLPSGICNLVHLRYLRISGAFKQLKLPQSIGNLRNMNTLDLRGNNNVLLPRTILSRLFHLRHLLLPAWGYSSSFRMIRSTRFENHTLRNIVTLKGIFARDLIGCDAVYTLCNIRSLEIHFENDREIILVLESLNSQLGHIQSLTMEMFQCESPNQELLSQLHVLSRLCLRGRMFESRTSFLPESLTKLNLDFYQFSKHTIEVVEKLPKLRIFHFSCVAYSKLVFSAYGFLKLEILELSFSELRDWEVEEGAIPNLKRLDIDTPHLKMIPEGLKYVTTLHELNIRRMTRQFEDRLRVNDNGIAGEDFYKVQHVPFISFSDTREW